MSDYTLPAVIDEATWPTHKHGDTEHRHTGAVEGHVHGLYSAEADALDKVADLLSEALQGEFGTILTAEPEHWKRTALGVLTRMHGSITPGDDGVVILALK